MCLLMFVMFFIVFSDRANQGSALCLFTLFKIPCLLWFAACVAIGLKMKFCSGIGVRLAIGGSSVLLAKNMKISSSNANLLSCDVAFRITQALSRSSRKDRVGKKKIMNVPGSSKSC